MDGTSLWQRFPLPALPREGPSFPGWQTWSRICRPRFTFARFQSGRQASGLRNGEAGWCRSARTVRLPWSLTEMKLLSTTILSRRLSCSAPMANALAYRLQNKQNQREAVVIDGKIGPWYDNIRDTILIFSPDGKRVAYPVRHGQKWQVVLDGKNGPEYDGIGAIAFSPDGRRVGYAALTENKWVFVVDGQPSSNFESAAGLTFSSDGRRVAYAAQMGKKWSILVDGREVMGGYDDFGTLSFSPDGRRLVYTAKSDQGWIVVVDGKASAAYEDVRDPVFSPDGKRVGYAAKKGLKWIVVVDREKSLELDACTAPVFSLDREHVAYAAKKGPNWTVIVDGRADQEFEHVLLRSPAKLTFASDGTLAYLASKDGTLYRVRHDFPKQQTPTVQHHTHE